MKTKTDHEVVCLGVGFMFVARVVLFPHDRLQWFCKYELFVSEMYVCDTRWHPRNNECEKQSILNIKIKILAESCVRYASQ